MNMIQKNNAENLHLGLCTLALGLDSCLVLGLRVGLCLGLGLGLGLRTDVSLGLALTKRKSK